MNKPQLATWSPNAENRWSAEFTGAALLALMIAFAFSARPADAQDSIAQAPAAQRSGEVEASASPKFTMGLGGHSRVGLWTYCQCNQAIDADGGSMRVTSIDGDGIGVVYERSLIKGAPPQCSFQVCRANVPLEITVEDGAGNTVIRESVFGPELIPSAQRWIVAIGDTLGIDSASEQQGQRSYPLVSLIDSPASLPVSWSGYSGVDLVIVAGSQIDQLNSLASNQRQALADWVRQGGRMLLTLGEQASPAASPDSWVVRDLKLPLTADVVKFDPRAIESFTVTQSPLTEFSGLGLPLGNGRSILSARTTDRQTVSIAMEYRVGFGRVLVIAADLDAEPFVSWPDRQKLLSRFLPKLISRTALQDAAPRADTGYTDIVGQVRRSVDRFDSHWVLPFQWLAGLMMIYLLLIGPVDYWIINRLLGRPVLGWVTFPVFVLLFAGLAYYGTRVNPATQPRSNQLSIVDLDPTAAYGRGFVWSQLLSERAGVRNLQFAVDPTFAASGHQHAVVGWWGIGGEEFGGLASTRREDQLPTYHVACRDWGNPAMESSIEGLPMSTGATKGLVGRWQFPCDLKMDSSLQQRRGTDLLKGKLQNPLPVDLKNSVLVYRGWIYSLPTRFTAQQSLADVGLIQPKNLKWRLTRRTVGDQATNTQTWNPSDASDLNRLAEMVMFFETAGASNYTQLNNHILGQMDLSHVLQSDCAMLIGQIDQPGASLQMSNAKVDGDVKIDVEKMSSFVRILVPVAMRAD